MKVIWRASLLKNCEQANQCNNSEETEEVVEIFDYILIQSEISPEFAIRAELKLEKLVTEFSLVSDVVPEVEVAPCHLGSTKAVSG